MSRSALYRVASVESLSAAFDTIFSRSSPRSRRSFGVDEQTLDDFDRNRASNLREISRQLRSSGGYQFSPLLAHLVRKRSGKDRVICVPTVSDRVVQRALSDYLAAGDRCGLENAVSFGFIPGRSVEKAVNVARDLRRKSAWVYKTDIASYFDSIPRDRLHAEIRRAVKDRSLHELLFRASTCEIEKSTKSRRERIKAAGIRVGVGVRQGMPLSPFFANLMLKGFDASIEERGVPMVRYADDLICFATSKDDCERIHGFVKAELAKDLLTVPDPGPGSKTSFSAPDEDAEFLGLTFRPDNGNYLLEVSSVQTEGIKKHLLELADVEHLSKLGVRIGGFFRRLDGAIAGYEGAYGFADNANHVSKVLQDARAAAIEKLFQHGLGISIASLSDAKKRFIGLIE